MPLNGIKESLRSVIARPPKCLRCRGAVKSAAYPFCQRCSPRFSALIYGGCEECGKRAADCTCFSVGGTVRVYWLFSYKGDTARGIIYFLKRRASFEDYQYLGLKLKERVAEISGVGMSFDCVTFVPRKRDAFLFYGYNHAEQLAKQLAKRFGIPCVDLLAHTGTGGEQKRLSKEYRGLAAKTRFCINGEALADGRLPYRRVLIADDIVTTGTTMGECAQILKSYGVKQVYGAAIARTPRGNKIWMGGRYVPLSEVKK